jgi:glutathione S-transferase
MDKVTAMTRRVLYQFPLSLYCEKAAWLLDAKGLPHRCHNMIPGLQVPRAQWMAGLSTLPILRDGKMVIGDSTAIALWLEKQYPELPLLPNDSVAREKVLALEGYFDELGDHVRRCVWSVAVDGPQVEQIFWGFSGYGRVVRMIGRCTVPLLRRMLRWRFQLYPQQVEESWQRVSDGLQFLESLLVDNPNGYLVDGRFSLADLTGATMLAPLIGPENSPWSASRLGIAMSSERRALQERLAGQWVLGMYARHRHAGL